MSGAALAADVDVVPITPKAGERVTGGFAGWPALRRKLPIGRAASRQNRAPLRARFNARPSRTCSVPRIMRRRRNNSTLRPPKASNRCGPYFHRSAFGTKFRFRAAAEFYAAPLASAVRLDLLRGTS